MNNELISDVIQWDISNWSKALPFWNEYLNKSKTKTAAAFGEREGGLSLWLAKKGFSVECSDFREIKNAKKLHEKHCVTDEINYSKQDITNIKFTDNSFDIVIFKSVIGALGSIDSQKIAINELYRVLKPGGYLLFAENLKGSILHHLLRKKFNKWSSNWSYPKLNDFNDLLKKFSHTDLETYGVISLFGRSENQRNNLALIDSIITKLTPKKWRYILFAACKK